MEDLLYVHSLAEWHDHNKGEAWLLLYKKGSEQSDCALTNYAKVQSGSKEMVKAAADVSSVRDIHTAYGVTSAPALLQFRNGTLVNVIKGCHSETQFEAYLKNDIFVSPATQEGKPAKRVTVYSTPTCSWCTTLKRYLDDHHVRYTDVDVSKDQKAAEAMVRRSGQQGVPQTDINGQIIVGFDRTRINKLLEINN